MSRPIVLFENMRAIPYVPFYLAAERGDWERAGAEVRIETSPATSQTAAALLDGRADVSWGGPMRVMLHHDADRACPLVCFGQVVSGEPFVLVGRAPNPAFRFADLAGCSHAVASRFWGGRAWGLVWSETQIGVEIAILAFADGRPRWHARRTIRRGDGGLPLSPVSAVVATGLAARTALDGDVLHSVLDDALRAALSDLPDLRDPQAFASRNSSVSPLSSRK